MKLEQVSDHCFAALNEKNRLCDANSGFINLGHGVVIDTQCDLAHARRMLELFAQVSASRPKCVVNTHEDADHVWGNQLFPDAEIFAHRSAPERIRQAANPQTLRKLLGGVNHWLTRLILKAARPGLLAVGQQLQQDYDFTGIELLMPTTLIDEHQELKPGGVSVDLLYVGPAHQAADLIVHVPAEGVLFSGDIVFRDCTPVGWTGSYENWLQSLDLILELEPRVIVPGHGPVCGTEGAQDMKHYLESIMEQSKRFFDQGASAMEAARRIELGRFARWRAPARVYMNVERAYREFRQEPHDAEWDIPATFQSIFKTAGARGLEIEF